MNKTNRKTPLVILFLIGILLMKPTMLGCNASPIGVITILLCIVLVTRGRLCLTRRHTQLIVIPLFYYLYMVLKELLQTGGFSIDYIKAVVTIEVVIIGCCFILGDKERHNVFVKLFIYFLAFWTVMYIIAIPFMIVAGDVERLKFVNIEMKGYGYRFCLYYPLVSATGRITLFGHQFLRNAATFRECGIAQIFYIWAYFESGYYFEEHKSKKMKIILFLGIIFCLSTAGFVCLIACMILKYILTNTKKLSVKELTGCIGLITVVVLLIWGIYNIPGLRIADKATTSMASRMGYYELVFQQFKISPIFGNSNLFFDGTATAFLQTIYRTGILGFILYYIIFIHACFTSGNWKRFLLANSACLITLTFSQPIYDAPLIYMLYALSYTYDWSMDRGGIIKSTNLINK